MSLNEALCREVAALLSELPSSVPSKPSSPLDKRNSQERRTSIFAATWNLLNAHDSRPSTAESRTEPSTENNIELPSSTPPPSIELEHKIPENDNGDNLSDVNLSLNLEGDGTATNGVSDGSLNGSDYSLNMLRLLSSTQVPIPVPVGGPLAEGIVPGQDSSDLYSMAGPPSTADSLHGLDNPHGHLNRIKSMHLNLEQGFGGKTMSNPFLTGNGKPGGTPSKSTASSRASSRSRTTLSKTVDSKTSQRNSSEGINAILQDSSRTSVGSTHRSTLKGPRCAHDYTNIVALEEASKMADEIPTSPFPYEKCNDRDDNENNINNNNNNNNNSNNKTASRQSFVSFTPILRESCSRTPETISKSFLQSVNEQIQNIKMNQARERSLILTGQLQNLDQNSNQNQNKSVYPYQGQYPCIHQSRTNSQIQPETVTVGSLQTVLPSADELSIPKDLNFDHFKIPMEIQTQTLNQNQNQNQSDYPFQRPEFTSTGTNKTIIIDQNIRNKVKAEFSIQTDSGSSSSPVPWGQRSSMDSQMAILARCDQKLFGCRPICCSSDVEAPVVVDDGRMISREFVKRRLAPRQTSSFFGRFVNLNDALSITNYSLKTAWNTADEIFRSYVIPPELEETLEATREEMAEADDVVAVSILRLLGLPIEARYAIYKEVLEELQVINDFSVGTIQLMTALIDWLCTGNHEGTADLVSKTRLFATSQTELDPDSEGWKQFERDICIFSRAVASTVNTAARAVSRQCSNSTECLASRFRTTRFPIEESQSPQPQTPTTPISTPPFTAKTQSQPISSTSLISNCSAQVIAGQVTESEFEFRPVSALTPTDSHASRASFQSGHSNKSRIPIPVKSSGNFNSSSKSGNNNSNNSREILKPEEIAERSINLGMLRDALKNKEQENSQPGRRHLSVSEFSQIPRRRQTPQKQRRLDSAESNNSDEIENEVEIPPSISSMKVPINTDENEKENAGNDTEKGNSWSSNETKNQRFNFSPKIRQSVQKSNDSSSSGASALFQQAAAYIPSFDDTFGPQVDEELKFPESNSKESNGFDAEAEDDSFFNSLQRAVETAGSMIFGGKQNQNYEKSPQHAVRSTTTKQSFGSIIQISQPSEPVNSRHSNSNSGTNSPSLDLRAPGQQSYPAKSQEEPQEEEGQSGQSTPEEIDADEADTESWPIPNYVKIQEAERAMARQFKKSDLKSDLNQSIGQNQNQESLTVQLSKACLNNLYFSLKDALPSPLITINSEKPAQESGRRGHSVSDLNLFPDVSESRMLRTNSGHTYYLNSRRSSSTSQVTDAGSETGISAVPSITSQMMMKVPKNSNVGFTQALAEQSMREDIAYLEEILKTLKESAPFTISEPPPSTIKNSNSRSRPKNSSSNSTTRTPSMSNTNDGKNTKTFGPGQNQSRIPMKKIPGAVPIPKTFGPGSKKPFSNTNTTNRNSEKPSSISLNQGGKYGTMHIPQPQSLSSSKIRNDTNGPTNHRTPRIIHTPTPNKTSPMKAKLQIIQAVPIQRAPYQVQLNRNYQYSAKPTPTTCDPSHSPCHSQLRSASRNSYRELMLRKNQTQNQNQVPLGGGVGGGGRSRTTGGSYSRRHEMAEALNLNNKTNNNTLSNLSYRGQRSNSNSRSRSKGPPYKYDDGTHEQASSFNSSKCSSTESSSRNVSNTPSSNPLSSNNNNNIHPHINNNEPTRSNPKTLVLQQEVESNYQNYHGGSGTPLFQPPSSEESSGSSRQPSLFFPSLESTGFFKPFANLTKGMNKVFSAHSQPNDNMEDTHMGHSH